MHRLLLIEDDAAVRQFVAMALEGEPLELFTCANLTEARRWHALSSEPPHAVLLDLMLPDGSGLELLKDPAFRERWPETAWLLFSAGRASSLRENLEQLQRWGVRDVLEKPVSLKRLLEAVRASFAPEPEDGTAAAQQAAIERFFERQSELFEQMRRFSAPQLQRDLQALGACAGSAASGLEFQEARRVAHSMKTVLAMLGCPRSSQLAGQAERAAEAQEAERLRASVDALQKASTRWPAG
jgi:DNA-binding response OmpR family regulator